MKFTSDCFDDNPDELLAAAARLTLRLSQQCNWVAGCEDKDEDDWNALYERILDLTGAFANSGEGVGQPPHYLMSLFASYVAGAIAKVPAIRVAVAADLAAKPDNDP